jgi:hypothetical protein
MQGDCTCKYCVHLHSQIVAYNSMYLSDWCEREYSRLALLIYLHFPGFASWPLGSSGTSGCLTRPARNCWRTHKQPNSDKRPYLQCRIRYLKVSPSPCNIRPWVQPIFTTAPRHIDTLSIRSSRCLGIPSGLFSTSVPCTLISYFTDRFRRFRFRIFKTQRFDTY